MEHVLLRADGAVQSVGKVFSGDPLSLLGCKVVLDEAYTLRSFFAMIDRYTDLARLNPFFDFFVRKRPDWPVRISQPLGLETLVLGKVVEMIGYPGEPRLEIYTSLHGLFEGKEVEIKGHPVETLLDTPFRLGECTHRVFGDMFEGMAFATVFTLFECVDGVAWQLSFHGSPMECALRR